MPAVVEKIIKPMPFSDEPEKAQIAIQGADPYYREIRIETTVTADPEDTTPKSSR
jgi:hypothetical protein